MKWLAIANPNAGALRNAAFRERWMPQLEHAVTRLVYTREPGEATALARGAADVEGIVVVGGDGTINEVLAGIDRARQRLAVVPAGRGNALARELGVVSMPLAIAALSAGAPVAIDLLAYDLSRVGGAMARGHAVSTVALGYVASTVRRAARFAPFGRYAYLAAATCICPARCGVEIAYDCAPAKKRRVTGVVINNTSWLGNFHAFPQASPSDGRLDVRELDAGWLRQVLHNLSVATRGRFFEPGRLTVAAAVRVMPARPTTVLIDGDLVDDVSELEVRCVPEALRCQGPATRPGHP